VGRRSFRRNWGIDRAMQHVSEARELSRELGGTDEDVKQYFFSLTESQLRPIFEAYEREHGKSARQYAETTFRSWRSRTTKMSGQTAGRLYALLPRFMPMDRKYALVESLWKQKGPRSEYSISFGPQAIWTQVTLLVRCHLTTTATSQNIPEPLQQRFRWLADMDAQVMQQMLNHFLQQDREQAVAAVDAQVAMILQTIRTSPDVKAFRRDLKLGNHNVHVFYDPRATDVTITPGAPRFRPAPDYSWLGCLGLIVVVIVLVFLFRSDSSSKKPSPTTKSDVKRQRR
jgi:hypothetical protein